MLVLHFPTDHLFEIKYLKLLTLPIKNEFDQYGVMFEPLGDIRKSTPQQDT